MSEKPEVLTREWAKGVATSTPRHPPYDYENGVLLGARAALEFLTQETNRNADMRRVQQEHPQLIAGICEARDIIRAVLERDDG